MMENALDTLKTAFPNPEPFSPVEDFEADGRTMDNRKYRWRAYQQPVQTAVEELLMKMNLLLWCYYKNVYVFLFLTVSGCFWFCVSCIRRLMFPSKVSPSLNIPDLHPKVTYCFSEGSTVSRHILFAVSEKWIPVTDDVFVFLIMTLGPQWHVAVWP